MNIEERITRYPELSEDERESVKAYVDEHPEWKAALDDARRLDELLSSARSLSDHPPGAEALAYFVATRDLRIENVPSDIADVIRKLRTRIERDPDLQEQAEQIALRFAELEEAVPAQAHFERLTGHDLHSYTDTESASGGTAIPAPGAESRSPNEWIGRRLPSVWRIAASIAALLAVYGILFTLGEGLRPEHERLGSFEADELVLDGYETLRGRGGEAEQNATVVLYLRALSQLSRSESSYLGLFPSFHAARLDSATVLLRAVIAGEPANSFLAGEATYMLGKAELARGRIGEAGEALSRVVDSRSRRADDARNLLSEIEE